MAINAGFCIWVVRLKPMVAKGQQIAIGTSLLGEGGFRIDSCTDFNGTAYCINSEVRQTTEATVCSAHIPREGLAWSISTAALPQPPFLMTDDPELRFAFSGKIRAQLTPDGVEVFRLRGTEGDFPIAGENWVGLFSFVDEANGQLIAFSTSGLWTNSPKLAKFIEWECELGTLF